MIAIQCTTQHYNPDMDEIKGLLSNNKTTLFMPFIERKKGKSI